jgi:hypothetical protein
LLFRITMVLGFFAFSIMSFATDSIFEQKYQADENFATPDSIVTRVSPFTAEQIIAHTKRLSDSLQLGLNDFSEALRQQDSMDTDSVKLAMQKGMGHEWREWIFNVAPREGMTGEMWLQIAEILAKMDRFDIDQAYEKQLEAYKNAAYYFPDVRYKALTLLLKNYREAGFAPGMITTAQQLYLLDEERAISAKIEYDVALAYYFLGDRKNGLTWINYHKSNHPNDNRTKALKKKIKKLEK